MNNKSEIGGIEKYWKYQRRISKRAFGSAVICGLIVFFMGYRSVARGLILGGLFSVINFSVMAYILPHQVGYQRKRATVVACASLFGRLLLLAVPIAVGFYSERFNMVATIIGLFTIPLFLLVDRVVLARLRGEYNL